MKMTLAKRIIDQLRKSPSGHAGEIQAVEGELQVVVKLADWDRLGCMFTRLDLKHGQGDDSMAFDPGRIEGHVTYLGERLKLIETEGKTGRTIMRSAPPRIDGNDVSFFELVLDGAEGLSLARYKYDRQRRERTPVPVALTRDTLERLLTDLSGLVKEN